MSETNKSEASSPDSRKETGPPQELPGGWQVYCNTEYEYISSPVCHPSSGDLYFTASTGEVVHLTEKKDGGLDQEVGSRLSCTVAWSFNDSAVSSRIETHLSYLCNIPIRFLPCVEWLLAVFRLVVGFC